MNPPPDRRTGPACGAAARAIDVIGLDDDEALHADVAGAKAAALARASRNSLPVLPGLVIPAACGLEFLEAAVPVGHAQGRHAAQLAVMNEVTAAATRFDEVCERAGTLGPVLVVRSSGRSEDDPRWAGAYSSVLDVRPGEVVAAIASCWASALSDDAVFRREAAGATLAGTCPAVLIQPLVSPLLAGTAICAPGEPVEVVAVRGSPAPLLAGHTAGLPATVAGSAVHGAALQLAGPAVFRSVAAVARAAGTVALAGGAGPAAEPAPARDESAAAVEWAFAEDGIVLLQVRPAAQVLPAEAPAAPPRASVQPVTAQAARSSPVDLLAVQVARYAGPLGERAVLPWLVADTLRGVAEPGTRRARPAADAGPGHGAGGGATGPGPGPGPAGGAGAGPAAVPDLADPGGAGADFEAALRLVPRAVAEAWSAPEGPAARQAAAVLALLATGDIDAALAEAAGLRTAAQARSGVSRALLGLLASVGAALVRQGVLAECGQIWGLRPDQVRALLALPTSGSRTAPEPAGWHGLRRRTLRWQPFLQAALARSGTAVRAEPASPGVTAGLARRIRRPGDIRALIPGEIAVVDHPDPRFAPMLWTAGGLVAGAGSTAAHLMEVARSLRVPALCAAPLDASGLGEPGGPRPGPDAAERPGRDAAERPGPDAAERPGRDAAERLGPFGGGYLLCVDGDNGVLTIGSIVTGSGC